MSTIPGNGAGGPIVCDHPECKGLAPITHDDGRRPLSLAVLVALLVAASSLIGGWVVIDGHLREARAAVVRTHDTSATSHADIRKAQERAVLRIGQRLEGVARALERLSEKIDALPSKRRRR